MPSPTGTRESREKSQRAQFRFSPWFHNFNFKAAQRAQVPIVRSSSAKDDILAFSKTAESGNFLLET